MILRKLRIIPLTAIVSIVFLVVGCWIPENFEAKISVKKDGSYTFIYDGTLTYALALAAAKDGSLSREDEAEMQREAATLRREPGFKHVDYLGKGRYKVYVEKVGRPGEPYYFLSQEMKIFAVRPLKDGTINITGIRPSKSNIQEFKSIGAKMDGKLTVSVARGIKVLRHNAQSEPYLFGLLGSYKWEIKSPDVDPFIVLKPSS